MADVPQTATREPLMGPRQDDLIQALTHRLRHGPPLSEADAQVAGFVAGVVFGRAPRG